ncbi:MAG: TlpA disulfide reductase family protein [Planctomycetota bacterium]|nr:TlpA disulfide reductase family protein [Planctomycetota bacterium]
MNRSWKMMSLALGVCGAAGLSPMPASAADQEQIDALMQQVMKAYEAPKAFSNSSTMTISFSGEKMEEQISSIFGADGSIELRLPNVVITVVDGYFYAEIAGVEDTYLKRPIGSGLVKTVTDVFGGSEIIPFDYRLRSGMADGWIESMTFGLMPQPKITSVGAGKDADGADSTVIEVSGPQGEMKIFVDPVTHLVTGADAQISPDQGPEAMSARVSMKMLAKGYEALPKKISFDPGTRKAVDSIEELLPAQPEPKSVTGKMAPDFTLPQYAGEEVTLSKLRGKIVIIDFWATWCGPCRRGLPLLQQFSDWAAKNTDDVVVYAVNVWERGENMEDVVQMVGDFWSQNKYTMPTLISMTDKITRDYGVNGIPVTVVIDKDGRIAKMHSGFSPKLFDELKAEVEQLRDAS